MGGIGTGESEGHRFAARAQSRHGLDQQVGAFDLAELADIDQVRRIFGRRYGIKLGRGHTVEDAADEALRRFTDHAFIGVPGKTALEQKQFGSIHQGPLHFCVEPAFQRIRRIVQGAAMGRVDTDRIFGFALDAHKGSGLGAVSMQHIKIEGLRELQELH